VLSEKAERGDGTKNGAENWPVHIAGLLLQCLRRRDLGDTPSFQLINSYIDHIFYNLPCSLTRPASQFCLA
jgi:hypothetical protein